MSTKKVNQGSAVESKKNSQGRNKTRRRSSRNTSFNGDADLDTKEKSNVKKSRDSSNAKYEDQDDVYKDIIDVVPAADLNCSPSEMPASPGTRVTLHGVILHETHGGLIVLNVRWRNKIYSGALIDVEKSKWAGDRLPSECNGGTKEFQTPPPIKKIKIPSATDDNDGKKKTVTSPTSGKTKSRPNAKKRSNQDRDLSPILSASDDVPPKKQKNKPSYSTQNSTQNGSSSTDGWIECPEPNCGKKYKNKNGLTCHIRKIHKSESLDESGKENRSESQEESDSGDDNFVIDERTEEDRANAPVDGRDEKESDNKLTSKETDENIAAIETESKVEPSLPSKELLSKEEMTENEKQIEKLKLETEKARAQIAMFKQESVEDEAQDEKKPPTEVKLEKKESEKTDDKIPEILPPSNIKKEEEPENENDNEKANRIMPPPPTMFPPPATPTKPNTSSKPDNDSSHPRGSSRTIIHQDHAHSLNELFSPAANNFHQFSPTLSSLNPQKINDSLTNALSKQQQQEKLKKTTPHTSAATETSMTKDVVKTPLGPKPSIDFKPVESNTSDVELKRKIGNELSSTVSGDDVKKTIGDKTDEIVDCSDDETVDSMCEMLKGIFNIHPQVEDEVKPPNMTPSVALSRDASHPQLKNIFTPRVNDPFQNKLMMEELASKVSNFGAYPNLPGTSNPSSGKMGPTPLSMAGFPGNILKGMLRFPSNESTNLSDVFNYMKQSGVQRSIKDDPRTTLEVPHNLLATKDTQPLKGNSLLEQRLSLNTQPPKSDINNALTKNLFLSRQYQVKDSESTSSSDSKSNLHSDATISPKPLFMSREQHPFDKQKFSSSNLRINPPSSNEERVNIAHTWFPEVSKDPYFNGPPLSSSGAFRQPNLKSSSGSNPSSQSSILASERNKGFTKRPIQPIPIAPAPQSSQQQPPPSQFVSPTSEYMTTEAEKDAAMMSRYTLTSDNRLIPSPAENRGRPRKVRGKLAQVPTTSQDPKLRSPNDMGLTRKPSSSPVVRASVIQGSTHPENVSLVKSPDRDSLMAAMGRPFEGGVDERFLNPQQHADQKLHSEMQRNLSDKYKNLSSPPGIYFNSGSQGRSIISPQSARPPSHSPRSDFPMSRSSPSVNPELFREGFHQRPMERLDKLSLLNEHSRGKADLLRSPSEHALMPESSRKSLSPHEALQMMEAFKRDNRLVSPGSRFPLPPTHRPDISHPHDLPASLLDRRSGSNPGPEESEHARFLAMQERKRLMQQAALFASGAVPSGPPGEHNSHHPNLFLERRDGAFLGPLSSFQNRPNEQHKR